MMAACLAVLLAPNVKATCQANANLVPQNIQLNVGRVLIQPSLPIGSRITLLTFNINRVSNSGSCSSNGGILYGSFTRPMTLVSGMNKVYQTDVPGVGIRLYREAGDVSNYYPYELPRGPNTSLYLSEGKFQVELIKTAVTTGSGPIASNGPFTTYYADGSGSGRPMLTSTLSGLGITIVTSTCEVDAGSKNIAVNFGAVSSNIFKGLGSKGPDRDFAINLICHGGNVAEANQGLISVRIDATQDSSKRPGVLAITSANDAASGVGIELVDVLNDSEHQIAFGQGIPLGRTPVNASSTLRLPLRARYIQTQAGKVRPGSANGTATFTIEYQ
ncbi:type 1 fimbrial protein [Xylella taiwanensis]|nr:fimbrial protein [Xylella taiwanensis]MCD8455520.1 type 1 fimbrial protein [Xylella taiwanensis]MCD8457928.1 type 1 fimbrial protein [Xylella taiwanensis]MCD8460062.1 type 1 fimbrial protein [Xylella taiwanensis]MCD8463879.1 type 1 fimbrial protein [Xylella taiwanensis]MCD8464566.1 type 1 fimbrial protein [Xylella taiwanensis]